MCYAALSLQAGRLSTEATASVLNPEAMPLRPQAIRCRVQLSQPSSSWRAHAAVNYRGYTIAHGRYFFVNSKSGQRHDVRGVRTGGADARPTVYFCSAYDDHVLLMGR